MSPQDRMNLGDAIRRTIFECRRDTTVHRVTELVMERYAGLVTEASERLMRESISKMVRSIMKNAAPRFGDTQLPLPLPAEISHLQLCDMISLPPEDGDSDEAGEDVCQWVQLSEATFDQLNSHIALLAKSIERDQRRLANVRQLRQYLAAHMEDRPFQAIGPVLKELTARQQLAAA